MSLIGEALKKARSERGSDLPANVYSVPAPRRSNLPWIVAAASISLALGVLVGAALFYRAAQSPTDPTSPHERSQMASSPESTTAQATSSTLPPEGTGGPPSETSVASSSGSTASKLPRQERPEPAGEEPTGEAEGTAPSSATPSTTPAASPPMAEPSSEVEKSPAKVSGPVEGHSYFKEVTLTDGRNLHLNGIVWSDASPAALINSDVYVAGEGAGSWTLLEVDRSEVQIEANGVRFALRLK